MQYVGTFELGAGKIEREAVKKGMTLMLVCAEASMSASRDLNNSQKYVKEGKSATLIICLEGIKVIDNKTQRVAMAHALHRVCEDGSLL